MVPVPLALDHSVVQGLYLPLLSQGVEFNTIHSSGQLDSVNVNPSVRFKFLKLCEVGQQRGQPLQLQRNTPQASPHWARDQHGRIPKCGEKLQTFARKF